VAVGLPHEVRGLQIGALYIPRRQLVAGFLGAAPLVVLVAAGVGAGVGAGAGVGGGAGVGVGALVCGSSGKCSSKCKQSA
jgi:hypothetical protein